MKYCKDCKYCVNPLDELSRCSHPKLGSEHLVTGKKEQAFCFVERNGVMPDLYPCGKAGNLWEAK